MDGQRARDRDFEASLADVNLAGARLGYVLSAVLMPAGVALDFVMAPGEVWQFFAIRLAAGALALLLRWGTFLPIAARYPVLVGAGPPLVCAIGIEAMILRLDSLVSPYYAGLNLCILAVAVLYTWRWQQAALVSGTILSVWLVPALPKLLRGELEFAAFFNNLYFLSLTSVIAVASAVIRYRGAEREYNALADLRHTSAELASTLERLQELDRLKNEFFANVSHELRTPLTLILTPIEDLLSREFPAPVRDALLMIRRNAQRLLRLIDDLLDLARLDVGGLRLHIAELDMVELVNRVAETARPAALARGMTLTVECAAAEIGVFGDMHRLEIVLTNLLGNALKFTPDAGSIAIRVRAQNDAVCVDVEDSGPGIPPQELERIFERFYQIEGSGRRRHGGAGIGLSLAKKLIELHGGSVSVTSTLGQGARFSISVPLGHEHFRDEVRERRRVRVDQHPHRRLDDQVVVASHVEVIASVSPPLDPVRMDRGRPARVLIAEDEPDLREYIETALAVHFDVESARDGAEALTKLRATGADLVLTDLMMPGTSGIDLCRCIKQDPGLRDIPVIALTALSSTDNVLEAYSAGADDFVVKPFHTRVLVARINAQLKLRSLSLQLADRARLATAGMFAGGVAHEVKNPLNAIMNAARLLPEMRSQPELEQKLLSAIVEGSQRIEDIVRSLEEHVHPAEGNQALPCDVKSGLDSSLRLLEHKMNGIAVHTVYASSRAVLAPARELNQVFLNLLDNARRAAASNIWVQVADAASSVEVTISDDGPGVPAPAIALIFEPFFTTRAVGEGTGLGLYLSRRIIDRCGGSLSYGTRTGGGAAFRVTLPAIQVSA